MSAGHHYSPVKLLGSTIFLGDQTGYHFRFLAERGFSPRLVWLSRHIRGLAVLLVGLLLFLPPAISLIATLRPAWHAGKVVDHRWRPHATVFPLVCSGGVRMWAALLDDLPQRDSGRLLQRDLDGPRLRLGGVRAYVRHELVVDGRAAARGIRGGDMAARAQLAAGAPRLASMAAAGPRYRPPDCRNPCRDSAGTDLRDTVGRTGVRSEQSKMGGIAGGEKGTRDVRPSVRRIGKSVASGGHAGRRAFAPRG